MAQKETGSTYITHPFGPLYSGESRVLILGSFPSVKSREQNFFYGHPQNRFWKVISALFGEPAPATIDDKKRLILNNKLALWDSIASCEITGSSDSSIRNVTVNDLGMILRAASIREIYVNGKTAEKMYRKYTEPVLGRPCTVLPSTSPANAAWNLERLTEAWRVIRQP